MALHVPLESPRPEALDACTATAYDVFVRPDTRMGLAVPNAEVLVPPPVAVTTKPTRPPVWPGATKLASRDALLTATEVRVGALRLKGVTLQEALRGPYPAALEDCTATA